MSSRASRTLYVGNLPADIREREVEDLFYKYGRIAHIDLKVPPRPPGYAFVEFEDAQDAEDAIRGRDGYDFDGHRLRVELAHGGRGNSSSRDRYSSHSSGRSGRGGVSRRSEFRVLVTGLPPSASWQDLKDHMRQAGDVCFSQVFRENGGTTGVVDYTNYEDMKLGNMIQRGMPLGALVVVDLIQEARAIAAAVVVAEVLVTARARASLQKPNLLAAHLLESSRDLSLDLPPVLALDQSLVLCQDMDTCSEVGIGN